MGKFKEMDIERQETDELERKFTRYYILATIFIAVLILIVQISQETNDESQRSDQAP
jgi:hypothetical protein